MMEIKLESDAVEKAISQYIRTLVSAEMSVVDMKFVSGRKGNGPSVQVTLAHEHEAQFAGEDEVQQEEYEEVEPEEAEEEQELIEEEEVVITPSEKSLFKKK